MFKKLLLIGLVVLAFVFKDKLVDYYQTIVNNISNSVKDYVEEITTKKVENMLKTYQ